MVHDPDLHGDYGTGFDWEDGRYPSAPKNIREQLNKERSQDQTPLSSPKTDTLQEQETTEEKTSIGRFKGVLLSVVSPYEMNIPQSEQTVRVGSIFLGNGTEWVRVGFWGKAAERVADFVDADPTTTLEVRGVKGDNDDSEISDLAVFADNDETGIEPIRESIAFTPEPISPESIKPKTLAPTVVAEVVVSINDIHTDNEGVEFEVQHLAVDIDGTKFVVELRNSHVDRTMELGDTIYVFAGWGKDKEEFIHPDLPDIDYSGKFNVANYSGVRNVTRNPLPDT